MVKNVKINLSEIKNECEASGISASNLFTCTDIAKFGQCVFGKVRKIVAEQKLSSSGTGNANSLPNIITEGEGDGGDESGNIDGDGEDTLPIFKIVLQKQ